MQTFEKAIFENLAPVLFLYYFIGSHAPHYPSMTQICSILKIGNDVFSSRSPQFPSYMQR
jgi:hypothetical protein